MDHGFPKIFGQSCEDSIQDDCAYINSHLNTFDNIDYRGHIRCKMQLDAGDQQNSRYSSFKDVIRLFYVSYKQVKHAFSLLRAYAIICGRFSITVN